MKNIEEPLPPRAQWHREQLPSMQTFEDETGQSVAIRSLTAGITGALLGMIATAIWLKLLGYI